MPYNFGEDKGFKAGFNPTHLHDPVDVAIDTALGAVRAVVNTPLGLTASTIGSVTAVAKDAAEYIADEIPMFLNVVGFGVPSTTYADKPGITAYNRVP
jgi:hypothetical protein